MTRGQILSHATRILKKISTKMRSNTSLLGRILLGITYGSTS